MYIALYRKYRPETFRDVISQEHITRTLQNQLKTGQLAHAYLFTGTRGTGKTTCAKILAKAVNCLHPVDGNPCLECESCRKIAEGSTDIVEMDAASNNSVDDVRQLRDEIVYTPIDVKYKVYIIDEVHMLSASAFNALLKTIEEPPSHIIFILATTDAHKVPATILSRCQRYQFRKIDPNDCAERLSEVAQKENALLHKDAALLLARLADGAMRDALSLLDQCVSTANEVTLQTVRECCGVAGSDALFAISAAAARKDGAAALKVVDELIRNSKDMTRFVDELTVHYRNLLLLKTVPDSGLVTVTDEEKPLYEEQLRQYSLEMIMRCLDILTGCLDDINRMKQTSQLRIMVEMVALRLCTPKLDSDTKALSMRIDELERRLNRGEFALTQAQPGETSATAYSKPQPATSPASAPQTASQLADDTPPWEEAPEQSGFVDETGFAMPPQTVLTAQTGPEPAASPASAPQTASQPTDDTPPWEEAPEQSSFVDETGFAMPPQTAEKPSPPPSATLSGQEGSRMQAAAHSTKQPIAVSGIFPDELENGPPVREWLEIVDARPPVMKGLMASSKAYHHDGLVVICVGAAAKTVLSDGVRADILRDAVSAELGREYPLVLAAEENRSKPRQDKLGDFLTLASEKGIQIITKNSSK